MRGPGRRAPVGRRSFRHSTVRAKGRCGTLRDRDVVPFGTCDGQGEADAMGRPSCMRVPACGGASGIASRAYPWGTRAVAPFGRGGYPASFVRIADACGAAGAASLQSLAPCHGADRRGRRGASSRRDGRRMPICVLPPEAKPCMSHDGGRGTAPCRGEKGGCHARCT